MRLWLDNLRSRTTRLLAAATCAAVTFTVAPAMTGSIGGAAADAAVRKIGPVRGLAATVTKPGVAYSIAATWNALSGATSYRVALTDPTGTLATKTVTSPAWTVSTTRPAGTHVTVKVTPVAGKRPGRAASVTETLPDLTAPTGTFTVDQSLLPDVTVVQDTLTDDVSSPAQITRSIDWGDGAGWESWVSGTTVSHHYPTDGVRYPQVQLVDEVGNTAALPLHVVVVGDFVPPTGSFTIAPTTGWAKLTPVRITQTALDDGAYSTPAHIARVVDWNDGTPPVTWSAGLTLDHVYAVGGSHTPTVTLTDEAGNVATPIVLDTVTSTVDAVAPVVTLHRPTVHPGYVKKWTTLRGRATDTNGTGVRTVRLRVVEKRGAAWYGYRAPSHTWAKATTKAGAVRKSRVASVAPNALHQWASRVRGLRKGTLFVWRNGTDKVGNVSATKVTRQVLNHL